MSQSDFSLEKRYWKKGYRLVIGVDEVGRGAFTGPVVAGACALKIKNQKSKIKNVCKQILKLKIDDSKKLSPKKRQELEKKIKKYFFWGIGEGSVGEINRRGIVKATERAMRRAIKFLIARSTKSQSASWRTRQIQNSKFKNGKTHSLEIGNWKLEIPKQTPFVLVDAFHVKYIPGIGLKNQKAIIHGDQKSISIAAASILAKVYRDTLMQKLALRYRKYHWEKNKGYGTKEHREAIARFGITKLHRKKFVRKWL